MYYDDGKDAAANIGRYHSFKRTCGTTGSEAADQPSWSTWFSEVWTRIPIAGRPVSAGVGGAVADAAVAPSPRTATAVAVVVVAPQANPSATT